MKIKYFYSKKQDESRRKTAICNKKNYIECFIGGKKYTYATLKDYPESTGFDDYEQIHYSNDCKLTLQITLYSELNNNSNLF